MRTHSSQQHAPRNRQVSQVTWNSALLCLMSGQQSGGASSSSEEEGSKGQAEAIGDEIICTYPRK